MSSDNVINIKALVEERKRLESEALGDQSEPTGPRLTSTKIKQCLEANYLGDGTLFAELHRGKFCNIKNIDKWMVWQGHYWQRDIMEECFRGVEAVADVYLKEAYSLKEDIDAARANDNKDEAKRLIDLRKKYFDRVTRLRSEGGVEGCLSFSHRIENPLAIRGDELDTNPWLMACANGVLDLRTGKLRDGRPEDHIIKFSPHAWQGIDAPCHAFEAFLASALDGDPLTSDEERNQHREQVTAFMQRALGYGITGLSTEHMFLVFNGAGRNGKGVLVETLRYVLGSIAGPIPAEMLLDQGRAATPSGPTPHIMALKGLRIAFASETDEGRRFSPGQVKWYSGGDTLKGRDLNAKDYIDFDPTHLLILLTNNLPHAPGDDFAFWQRLKLIPFNYSFVADPDPCKRNQKHRDDQLREKLKSEASGILAWLVRGCLEWQRQGLKPPEQVTNATEEYRMGEDTITQFVSETCDQAPEYKSNATEIYNVFKRWYRINITAKPGSCPAQKKFGSMLGKQFKKEKVGGNTRYFGLTLKENVDQLYPVEEKPGR